MDCEKDYTCMAFLIRGILTGKVAITHSITSYFSLCFDSLFLSFFKMSFTSAIYKLQTLQKNSLTKIKIKLRREKTAWKYHEKETKKNLFISIQI